MPETSQILEKKYVAALTTNSLKEILNLFPYTSDDSKFVITRLKANCSKSEKDPPMIEDPRLGITGYLDKRKDAFYMDYVLHFDDDGKKINPIDRTSIDTLINILNKLGLDDAAVDEINVIVKDKELGEVAGNNEELFSMTLISDPVDGDMDRNKVKEHQVNQDLVKQSGFKYRVLHCKRLIDRKQELTLPKSQHRPFIQWEGDTFYSLRTQPSVVQKVKSYFDPYSLIKAYGPGQEDTLVLLDVNR